jgi:hypothetical protein
MSTSAENKDYIFKQFRHLMGAPTNGVEILDETLCSALELAIEQYGQYVLEWLIEHQWQSLFGQDITKVDMAFALTTRSFDFMTQYTYAYSKQVGLQSRGPWELKKDYVELERGKQVYQIPAGREINEVLWITPPTVRPALFANFGGFGVGLGGGFAQTGGFAGSGFNQGGFGYGGVGGHYVAPAFDVLLTASDMNLKNRMIRSELTYKITAGPDGTRLLHLLSVPGSRLNFGVGTAGGGIGLTGCQVWYHYYDVSGKDVDKCRKDNPDIIKLPNEVPLTKIEFDDMNEPAKALVKQLFFAEAKKILGRTRGKYGGIIGTPNAQRTMDFDTLLSEGNEEKKQLLSRLDEYLKRLSSTAQIERAAKESEDLNKHLKYRPLGFWVK